MDALDRQQQQQFAGMRASMEASHRRQLETERRKHEHKAQQYDILKEQTEKLAQELHHSKAQVAALQQKLQQQQDLGERRSSASGSSGGVSDRQQLQQRERLRLESAVRELQSQLAQARQENGDLQAQLDGVLAENATHKAEVDKQVRGRRVHACMQQGCMLGLGLGQHSWRQEARLRLLPRVSACSGQQAQP